MLRVFRLLLSNNQEDGDPLEYWRVFRTLQKVINKNHSEEKIIQQTQSINQKPVDKAKIQHLNYSEWQDELAQDKERRRLHIHKVKAIRAGKTNQRWSEMHKGRASWLTHEGTGFHNWNRKSWDNKQKHKNKKHPEHDLTLCLSVSPVKQQFGKYMVAVFKTMHGDVQRWKWKIYHANL